MKQIISVGTNSYKQTVLLNITPTICISKKINVHAKTHTYTIPYNILHKNTKVTFIM